MISEGFLRDPRLRGRRDAPVAKSGEIQ